MEQSLQHILTRLTKQAFGNLYSHELEEIEITFQPTRKEFSGDITLLVFPLIKHSRRTPEQTGQEIGSYLAEHIEEVASFSVVRGFLNISMSDAYWLSCLQEMAANRNFGLGEPKQQKVLVEFSSPNTNKPLHLGHVRNNVLGFSICEILSAAGYEVVRACLVNDRGIHICKSMLAWKKYGQGDSPARNGEKGDHLVGKYYVLFDQNYRREIKAAMENGATEEAAKKSSPLLLEAQEMLRKWEDGDPETRELWAQMNSWVYAGFAQTYDRLGIRFDKFYYESETYLLGKDIIEKGLAKGVFERRSDGSVWIDLTADGLDEKLVLRADGTSVYITQDLGTAELKYRDFQMDQSIFVVGNEQDYHFKVLFLILEKLNEPWVKSQTHMSYGMVDLPSGKMKSREGTVVDADELMDEMQQTARLKTEELGKVGDFSEADKLKLYNTLGMGALKYFLLRVDPKKRLLFDPKESIDFQGTTGPFIQYSYARIRSILRKAGESPLWQGTDYALNEGERDLVKCLFSFPETVQEAAKSLRPDLIASYLYELGRLFNRFYHENQVILPENLFIQGLRVNLCNQSGIVIKRGMGFLGIEVPEQM